MSADIEPSPVFLLKVYIMKHKRIKPIIAFLISSLFLLLQITGCTKTAESFIAEEVENGFLNHLAGGNMAYFDNSVYLVYNAGDSVNIGTYKINDMGVEDLLADSRADYIFNTPCFYQYKNELYNTRSDNGKIQIYNDTDKSFIDSELKIEIFSDTTYISDNLLVWNSDSYGTLNVKTNNDETVELNQKSNKFYVENNTIFLINTDGWLYSYDVKNTDGQAKFLSYLNEDIPDCIAICGDYLYYNFSGNNMSDYKTGLYRYSFDNNTTELILEKDIYCLNTYSNKLYISTENGIYVYDENKCSKFSGIKATEIYIFDTEWLYTNDNYGNVYRIGLNDKNTEKVDFFRTGGGSIS